MINEGFYIMYHNIDVYTGWDPKDLLDGKFVPERFGTYKETIEIENDKVLSIKQRRVYSMLKNIKIGNKVLCYDCKNKYFYANTEVSSVSDTIINGEKPQDFKRTEYNRFKNGFLEIRGDIKFTRLDSYTIPLNLDELKNHSILDGILCRQSTISKITKEQYKKIVNLTEEKNRS